MSISGSINNSDTPSPPSSLSRMGIGQNKLPSHLLLRSHFRLYWEGNGAILRPSAFPWFIWPHSSHFNAEWNCKRNILRRKWARKWMNRKSLHSQELRRMQLSFKEKDISIFIMFFFLFRNVLRFRIVCLNAGCKDLLVLKVWQVLNLHILKMNAHFQQQRPQLPSILWR